MNWDSIIIAAIVATPPTVVALAALIQAWKTHNLVNSRMTELLEIARKEAAAQATLDEKGAEQTRKGDAAIAAANIAAPKGD